MDKFYRIGILAILSLIVMSAGKYYFNQPAIGFLGLLTVLSLIYVAFHLIKRHQNIFDRWFLFVIKFISFLVISACANYWYCTTYYSKGDNPSPSFPLVINVSKKSVPQFEYIRWRELRDLKTKWSDISFKLPEGEFRFTPDNKTRVTFRSVTDRNFHEVKVFYEDNDYGHYGIYRVYDNNIDPIQYRINHGIFLLGASVVGGLITTFIFSIRRVVLQFRKVDSRPTRT
jgi:hypothetical protein